jgi:hypothetical protein
MPDRRDDAHTMGTTNNPGATILPRDTQHGRPAHDEPIYTTEEAARIVGVAPKTLRSWRSRERGPRFLKYGNRRGRGGMVFYPASALDEFKRLYMHTPPEVCDGGMA